MLCKPDALVGPSSTVAGERASAFLLTLAGICGEGHGEYAVPCRYEAAARAATRQVRERAESEPSFRGEVQDVGAVLARLHARAATVAGLPAIPIQDVVIGALEALGFRIAASVPHRCSPDDVGNIYGFDTTSEVLESVPRQLLSYLGGQMILIIWLEGSQSGATLEWWKTAARHVLIDRVGDGHLLVNLVHVCGGSDAAYLSRLRPHGAPGTSS